MTSTFYSWTDINNSFDQASWLDYIVAWDDSSVFLASDYFLMDVVTSVAYWSSYFITIQVAIFTQIDIWALNIFLGRGWFFIDSIYLDILSYFDIMNVDKSLFSTEGFELSTLVFFLNPETALLYLDFVSKWVQDSTGHVTYLYDYFFFNMNLTDTSGVSFLTYAILWLFVGHGLFVLHTNTNFIEKQPFMFLRIYFTQVNLAFENRTQFDWTSVLSFFLMFIWIPLLMTYDDTNVEVIELFHWLVMFIFGGSVLFLLFRYSTHYFSFLEASVGEGFNASFIAKQFVRDVSNSFALFLRFFLLVFRLNIYDGLDDFLDSYFIFFIDYDEDMYIDETLGLADELFVSSDNAEDVLFYNYYEYDWTFDLFSKYFIFLGKFLFFWAFILEEAFRVILAFYISYLIIFEVHAVNASYSEEQFVKHNN